MTVHNNWSWIGQAFLGQHEWAQSLPADCAGQNLDFFVVFEFHPSILKDGLDLDQELSSISGLNLERIPKLQLPTSSDYGNNIKSVSNLSSFPSTFSSAWFRP